MTSPRVECLTVQVHQAARREARPAVSAAEREGDRESAPAAPRKNFFFAQGEVFLGKPGQPSGVAGLDHIDASVIETEPKRFSLLLAEPLAEHLHIAFWVAHQIEPVGSVSAVSIHGRDRNIKLHQARIVANERVCSSAAVSV